MFWCVGGGGHISKPGQKPIKVVTEIRLTDGNHSVGVTLDGRWCRVRALGRPGFETAKTILLCPDHLSEAPQKPRIINPEKPKKIEQIVLRSSTRK